MTAALAGILTATTGTGIGSSHQEETAWKFECPIGPGDADVSVLEWLAECLERVPAELAQLVEEEHSMVRTRDLSRAWPSPTAEES
jgi:hypothetical protein